MRSNILSLVLLALSSALLVGCSVTGWTSKEMPDGSGISHGNTITVLTKDGSELTGEYLGISQIPFDSYAEGYRMTLSEEGLQDLLPKVGETVQISTRLSPDKCWEGKFISFDQMHLSMKVKGKTEPEQFYISSIAAISKTEGKTLRTMGFRKLFESGDLPLRSAILLRSNGDEHLIPINRISGIESSPGALQAADDLRAIGFSGKMRLGS